MSPKEVEERAAQIAAELMEELLPQPPKVSSAEHNRRARLLVAEDRWEQRQAELTQIERQRAIDAVWERTLAARAELAREAGCHRGQGDPDFDPAERNDPMCIWRRPR
jgi:hypothetical protein